MPTSLSSIDIINTNHGQIPFKCSGMLFLTVIQIIYGLPSLALMIFFFFLFSFYKIFSNSFYRLLQIDLLVNVTCYINSWISLRLDPYSIGVEILYFLESHIPGLMTWSRFLCTLYFHAQNVTGYSLYLHRLTSTKFIHAENFWKKYYILVLVIAILYSFGVMSPWWIGGNFTAKVEMHGNVIRKVYNGRLLSMQYIINPIFAIFYFLIVLLTGIWTSIRVSSRSKCYSRGNERYVKKLTRIALFNSFLMSGNLLFTMILGVLMMSPFRVIGFKYHKIVVSFTSDMYTLAMPYILIMFDSNVQRLLKIRKQHLPLSYRLNQKTISNNNVVDS